MAQGTSEEASWGIAEGGFGVVASANDQGWFGKGFLLFSSFLFLFPFPFSRNEEYESEITIKKTKKKKKKKGIYFTSSLENSMRYSDSKKIDPKTQIKDLSKREYVLICAVVPGNVLPVVDLSLYGKPVQDGYQAHYVIGTFFFYFYYLFIYFLIFLISLFFF